MQNENKKLMLEIWLELLSDAGFAKSLIMFLKIIIFKNFHLNKTFSYI
jgi:hypothetical protein